MVTVISESPGRQYNFARRLSHMTVSAVREILKVTEQPEVISFAGGLPAPELFPVKELARAHADVFAEEGPAAMQYSTTEGWRPLREWIASRLRQKGVDAQADRVLITTGSQQGIDLVARLFLDAGDTVVVENPCYLAALQAFSGFEASFIAIDSDHSGMRVDGVERALKKATPKLIYVVSEFHNPKGTTLSAERREHLIDLSAKYGVPILEDDPYGELRFTGHTPRPLAAMDNSGLVIYLSTFSKTLSPGIRVGWVLAPEEIFNQLVIAKQAADLHSSTVVQRAAARLLSGFDYNGHIERIRAVYRERCRTMLAALESSFPSSCRWTTPEGGLFLWVELPEHVAAEALLEDAVGARVAFVPGAPFFASSPRHNFIRLNFSNCAPERIAEGIERLGKVLKRRTG